MDIPGKKKKKVDYEALQSAWMQIPRMDAPASRALLDIGLRQPYEIVGRAPETLFEELRRKRPDATYDILYKFRMAVYYVENDDPDPSLMHPLAWTD